MGPAWLWRGVEANLVSACFLAVAGIGASYVFVFQRRRKLFDFFGIYDGGLGLAIVLSRLQVVKTTGVREIKVGYQGPALTQAEYVAACELAGLFDSRLVARTPKPLRDFLGPRRPVLVPLKSTIDPSPVGPNSDNDRDVAIAASCEVEKALESNQTLIIVGSPAYNLLAAHFIRDEDSVFQFKRDDDGLRYFTCWDRRVGRHLPVIGRQAREETDKREVAVVQRLRLPYKGARRTVIICAGLGSRATLGAVHRLIADRHQWHRKHGDKDFAYCVGFEGTQTDARGDERETGHIIRDASNERPNLWATWV